MGISHHRNKSDFATCGDVVTLWDAELRNPLNEYQWGVDSVHCVKFNQVNIFFNAFKIIWHKISEAIS